MAENRMELFIETLTGTAFELSCSPFETIVSIKAKIQYSEGIPVSQQHLIWKSQELNDDLCLQDYHITDGATLKLVLGMRGGPINTRQISGSKKFQDLSHCLEKRVITSGSEDRPLTVLIFHEGDEVHMFTLMKRECTVSPVSGAVSDTSSVASSKHIEELDQQLIKENEITKEKITQLQEQLRALNIKKSKKSQASSSQIKENITPLKTADEKFHLPAIQSQRVDALDSQTKQYLKSEDPCEVKKDQNFLPFVTATSGKSNKLNGINDKYETECFENCIPPHRQPRTQPKFLPLSDKISQKTPPKSNLFEPENSFCSGFLPYVAPSVTKKPIRRLNSSNDSSDISSRSFFLNRAHALKKEFYKWSDTHFLCPLTSSQTLSATRLLDLDHRIHNRPKTTPEVNLSKNVLEDESLCKNKFIRENCVKQKLKRIRDPLSISLSSGEKEGLLMETYANNPTDIPCEVSSTSKSKASFVRRHSKTEVATFLTNLRALKECSPSNNEVQQENISKQKNVRNSPKRVTYSSRPSSGRKLPLIKAKKKSFKRCTLCSKRTGLATSYTCRCGKNFCAPHRYAEVHHCSYDYKTEGRRMIQLNNPVVAASKLPKI